MSPLRKKFLFIAILCAFFLSSCVPSLITSQGREVKTVALVSVSANRIINETQTYPSGEDYFKALKIDKRRSRKSARFVRSMLRHATSAFAKEFKEIKQWKLVSGKKVLSSKAYRKFAQKMKANSKALLKSQKLNGKLFFYNFRTPNISKTRRKMLFAPNIGLDEAEQKILGQLAKSLKVDAVAILDVDMAYIAEDAPNTFSATAGVSLVMIDQNGQIALATPSARGGADSPFRLKSDASVSFPKGKKTFGKKIYAMFKDSIKGGIGELATQIQTELAQ